MLHLTKAPHLALQNGSYDALRDVVVRNGLNGFAAVLAAHVAAWHNTAKNIATHTTQKAHEVYSGPVPAHIESGLAQVRAGCDAIRKSYTYHFLPDGSDDSYITTRQATHVTDINVHGPAKLEVSQIFSLLDALEGNDRATAAQGLMAQAVPVAQAMKNLVSVEDELEREARARNVPSLLMQNISRNAAYHKTVAFDWTALALAAQSLLPGSCGGRAPAPIPGLSS